VRSMLDANHVIVLAVATDVVPCADYELCSDQDRHSEPTEVPEEWQRLMQTGIVLRRFNAPLHYTPLFIRLLFPSLPAGRPYC